MRLCDSLTSALLAALVVGCSSSPDGETGPTPPDLSSMGGERPVEPEVPAGYDPATPAPLLIMLHGFGASGAVNDLVFRLGGEIDARGFIFLRPDGTRDSEGRRFWNATDACCDWDNTGVDDVAYIQSLIDEAKARFNVVRVALIGHSNGGFMSHRFACDRAGAVDAFASVAGSTWQDASKCQPDATVKALQIHGSEDPDVPIEGRPEGGDEPPFPGAAETIARWAGLNGCAPEPQAGGTVDFSDDEEGAETKITRHPDCDGGGAAELWVVEGQGHIPGLNDAWRQSVLDFLIGS